VYDWVHKNKQCRAYYRPWARRCDCEGEAPRSWRLVDKLLTKPLDLATCSDIYVAICAAYCQISQIYRATL